MNKYLGIIIILLSVIGIETGYIAYTEIVRIREMQDTLASYELAMEYLGNTTSKVGRAIQINGMSNDAGSLLIYVQNIGDGTVTLDSLYINGIKQTFTNSSSLTLSESNTVALSTAFPSDYNSSDSLDVKVVCTDGTFMEATQTIP